MRLRIVVVLMVVLADTSAQAGPFRRYRPTRNVTASSNQTAAPSPTTTSVSAIKSDAPLPATTKHVDDALAEVNAERAKRGLRPFLPDPLLNQAARTCAKIRATNHIEGHLDSDFAYLPKGASASAAGCGALEPWWGWGTCCTYENFTYAGAAWVMGSDGNRYMHLFVR